MIIRQAKDEIRAAQLALVQFARCRVRLNDQYRLLTIMFLHYRREICSPENHCQRGIMNE